MGGPVTIAKRENGKTVASNEYTSAIKNVQDIDFLLNKKKDHWLHCNLDDNKAEFAPDGYGIVIIDFDTKWIGHIQGYTDPGAFYAQGIALSLYHRIIGGEGKTEHQALQEAIEVGAVKRGTFVVDLGNGRQQVNEAAVVEFKQLFPEPTYKQLIGIINKKVKLPGRLFELTKDQEEVPATLWDFQYEPAGWTIQRFDESYQGYLDLVKVLLEKDFPVVQFGQQWADFVEESILDEEDFDDSEMDENEGLLAGPHPKLGDFFKTLTQWQRDKMDEVLPQAKVQSKPNPLLKI